MKHSIILRRRTAALLSCTLCCTCLTVLRDPASADMNSDGILNAVDLSLLKQAVRGSESADL